MHRLKKASEAVVCWAKTVGSGASVVLRRGGRALRVALAVAWIAIMLTAALSVFRLTYGRPWFSAPASMIEQSAERDLQHGTEQDNEAAGAEVSEAAVEMPGPARGDLMWPAGGPGSVIVEFGLVTCPTLRRPVHHPGIDIEAEAGTPVRAAYDGRVTEVAWDRRMGSRVVVDHGGGITTIYACLEEIRVSVGQKVIKGQMLGTIGNSGLAEVAVGPHVHFEVRVSGIPVNPELWLGTK